VARVLRRVVVVAAAGVVAVAPSPALAASGDWPQYLHGPQHSSVSATTAFTTANAGQAKQLWHFQPGAIAGNPAPGVNASPTVVGSRVYIGAESGMFYVLDATTGKVVWKRLLDVEAATTCPARGITSTAAVVPDPTTGKTAVYVSGARDLYALNSTTGAVIWKTMIGPASPSSPNAYYNWSSPTVVAGHVYVGLSSSCDKPQVRSGVVELNQHTGAVQHTWSDVPAGSIGGSVWASVAASSNGRDLWVSTGNECETNPSNTCPAGNQNGNSVSIVHLGASLGFLGAYQPPGTLGHDWDFGSSPTLFGSGSVGACNKNGTYYALVRNPLGSHPLWTDVLGAPAASLGSCIASAIWGGGSGSLFVAGDATTIGGTSYGGSLRKVNPATGGYIWQTGLPCAVMGTPSLDGAGVIAAGTYTCPSPNTPGAYLLDAGSGAVLTSLPVNGSKVFGQPVFAGGSLFVASASGGIYAFAP
jgi:outer membrane protein assembly factor BamB